VVQVLLVFLLDIDWHGMVMDELDRLMRLSVLVLDVMVMLGLGWVGFVMIARMLVDDAGQCHGGE
jgi:hypothetical protein